MQIVITVTIFLSIRNVICSLFNIFAFKKSSDQLLSEEATSVPTASVAVIPF
jgi:hypothetical protein